ncbi:MAG: hypothetical protein GQ572_01285 [Gammaproteobacteria bacterium]|jgi:hypothetical protein|nr:hypothetical protein [Gammaproteobacteria bacterium]
MAAKKKASTERATAVKQKLRDRVAAAAAAVAEAKAEVALTRKRQDLLIKMAERKEAAVAKFVESWSKKEMAKIEQALKPKKRKSR